MRTLITVLAVSILLGLAPGRASQPAAGPAALFSVDCTEAPDLKDWGDKAKAICEEWYPKTCVYLASDGFTPPASVKLVFKKEMKAPAATLRAVININAEYVGKHKDDFGMVVHELTHVVQAYPRNKGANADGKPAQMGWLVEGIADYVRFFQYEPQTRIRVDPKKASYKNGYRVAAAFLAWLEHRQTGTVQKLNAALRAGDCGEAKFKEIAGKELNDLWKEFVAGLPEIGPKPEKKTEPEKKAEPEKKG